MSYPIVYEVDFPEKRNRLTIFFRGFLSIPWLFISWLYGLGTFFTSAVAWFVLVFSAKYPKGLYDFGAGLLRTHMRITAWYFLQVDAWPPFDTDEHPEYPVRIAIAPPQEKYSRLHVFFRYFTSIPVFIIGTVLGIGLYLVTIVVWIVSVIAGKTPEGLQSALRFCLAYQTKSYAYSTLLLTDAYPNFDVEEGSDFTAPAPPPPSGMPVTSSPPPPGS